MFNGTGIRIPTQDSPRFIIGFYTTRLVRAASEEEAAQRAKENILTQWHTPEYTNSNIGSIPMLNFESVIKTTFFDSLFFRGNGHSFYLEEDYTH